MSNLCCSESDQKSRVCAEGAEYVKRQLASPPKNAVMACEGACVKGEIARVAANILAYRLEKDHAIRICLGDAATGNSGFTELVERAPEVIAIEGCPLQCGKTILKQRIPNLKPKVIIATQLYKYDKSKFEIFDMSYEEIQTHAQKVAETIHEKSACDSNLSEAPCESCC